MPASNAIDERSRSAAADDDGTDQIGSDTPRSGVATPQPDLHDKRLPGIMSYFNQVRPASFKRLLSGNFIIPSTGASSAANTPSTASTASTARSSTSAATTVAAFAATPPPECDHESESAPVPPSEPTDPPSSIAAIQPPVAPAAAATPLPVELSPPASSPASPLSGDPSVVSGPTGVSVLAAATSITAALESGTAHTTSEDDLPPDDGPPLLPHERLDPPRQQERQQQEEQEQRPLSPSSSPQPPQEGAGAASSSSLHPYPTPPASVRGVSWGGVSGGRGGDGERESGRKDGTSGGTGNSSGSSTPNPLWEAQWTFRHKKSISDVPDSRTQYQESTLPTPLEGIVTPSSVLARHFSVPTIPPVSSISSIPPASSTSSASVSASASASTSASASASTSTVSSPSLGTKGLPHTSAANSAAITSLSSRPQQTTTKQTSAPSSSRNASVGRLKKLTVLAREKSGQSTPTRSMSTAQQMDTAGSTTSGTLTPQEPGIGDDESCRNRTNSSTPTPSGAQAPAPKGKLTIKIVEARGLRRCRDPYVVAVFQRSELISGGPRPSEEDENAVISNAMGGIPIQRQGSDTGRTPMAIPMRSRQSSSTSVTDYNNFRSRSIRQSLTNPKWDAEAVFDVVDSNMLVDLSVYDHATTGEEFLGHVDFQANSSVQEGPVRGWFPLRGHADTIAENAPTGEIYVEALYQRTERKHFGPDDFEILRLIGKGTFGQVYQVRKKDTRRIYAMKVLSKKKIVQKKEVAHTVGERNILVRTATSDSPFIVGLKFSFQTPSDLYLVTDYMSGGELFWHLQKEGRFEEGRAKFYIAELILAIEHLHNNDIVYRDLKPENILLDANGHIALCDFGLSKANLTKDDTTNTFCGTTEYLAPEVLLDEAGYTKMVDFWSLGVLVFEMCCGWSPFYAEDTQQMYKNIAFGKVRFPKDTLSAEGRSFVKGLLNRNPKHRLGATKDAAELMEHPFFTDINWNTLSRKLITPPFKPKLKSDTDVSYFDPAFTNAMDKSGSLNERAAALSRGIATSTPLSPSMQANFQGFTFVDESALDDHMRGRGYGDEDDYMEDAHYGRRQEAEWDDMNDVDPRRLSRMSGIVRTTTNDEHMVGNSQFDM